MSVEDESIPAKRHRLKTIETYEVSADDFDRIEQEASQVGTDLQFAIGAIPLGIGLAATLLIVPIQDIRVFVFFLVITLVALGLGLQWAVRGWRQRGWLKWFMQKIRDNQVGPMGEEGNELRPSELEKLPGQAVGYTQPPLEPAAAEEPVGLAARRDGGDQG